MSWKFWQKRKSLETTKTEEENFTNIVNGKTSDLKNDKTGQITKSALEYSKQGRFLKLKDSDCAIVMHEGGKVEIIFTKLYDPQNQEITADEQTLMALAVFLKQPGFAELIRHEFNRIASRNIDELTENIKEEK